MDKAPGETNLPQTCFVVVVVGINERRDVLERNKVFLDVFFVVVVC